MATCKETNDSGSDQITQLCDLCESSVSDGVCDECGDYMCRPCFDLHARARKCRHHVLLDDLSESSNKKSFSEPCERHPNLHIEYYCIGHGIVGCVKCFFTEHKSCQHQTIQDAVKTFKDSGEDTRIQREIQRLDKVHSNYTEQCEQDQEMATAINNTAVEGVKSFKDKFISYIATVEEVALETAEKLRLENEKHLEKRTTELDTVAEDIEMCMAKLENPGSADKLFIASLEVKPTVEKLGRKMSSLGNQNVVTKYEFKPNKVLMEMIQKARPLGDVSVMSGDTNESQQVDQAYSETKPTSKKASHIVGKFELTTPEGIKVRVYKDCITILDVDCIVNAVNSRLQHKGGVARVISEAAGDMFKRECKQYIREHVMLPVGEACSTTAGNLPYKCVIHAVGPTWNDYNKTSQGLKDCEDDLMYAVLNSFREAEQVGMRSIALPPISSAIYGVPMNVCVKQYVRAVREYSKTWTAASGLSEIHFVDINERSVSAIQGAFEELLC